ncbi:MAG TPA: WD40 repeat domain-containing protein, partial [Pirellulales bacterium]
MWDVAAGAKAADDPLPGMNEVRSANGRAIAQVEAARDGSITVYDRASKKRRSVHTRGVFTAAAWSPDGRALAAATTPPHSRIDLWTPGERLKLEALPSPGADNETVLLNWLDGGALLDAYGGSDAVVLSRGAAGWQSRLLGIGVTTWANRQPLVAVSADGTRFAGVPQSSNWKTVRILDVTNGKPLRDLTESDTRPAAIALSPNGDRLACFNADGGFVIWETATGNRQRQAQLWPKDRFINEALISWSPDGARIALSTPDGVVRLMDDQLNLRRELAGHDYGQGSFGVKTLRFSDDGQTLQTADDRRIRV